MAAARARAVAVRRSVQEIGLFGCCLLLRVLTGAVPVHRVRDRGERGVRQHRRPGIVLVSYGVLPCAPGAGDGTGANAVLESRMEELGATQDELVGRTCTYVRCGPRRRRDERTSRSRRPSRRACEVGEGSHQGARQRSGIAAAQRRRTPSPGPVRTGRRVLHHRGLVLHRRPQPRPGAAAPERIRHVRRPLPGRPDRNAGTGQPLGQPLSMLAHRRRNGPEALAAAQASQASSAARRDPFFDSPGQVRAALAMPPSPSRLSVPLGIDFRISGDRPPKRTR